MAFALKGAGSASTDWSITANQASFVLTTSTTAGAANDLAVLLYAVDNNQTTDGDEGAVTGVTDSAGNFWQKAVEFTNGQGTAQTGATNGIWYCNLQNALAIGATVTLAFSNNTSRDAAAVSLTYFTKAAGFKAAVEGTPGTLAADAAAPGSLSVTTANIACLRIRAIASESSTATALTKTAAFTAVLTQAISTGGASTGNQGVRGEYLISTGTGTASNPTGGAGSVDHASTYVAFREDAFFVGEPPTNSDDVGGQVAVLARKAVSALLITASAGMFMPLPPRVADPAAPATALGVPVLAGGAARARQVYYQSNFVAPYAPAAAAATPAPQGWQAPLSVAVRIGGPTPTQPSFVVPPFVVPQGWQQPLSAAPPAAKAQQGNSFVPFNTAQLAVNYTVFGWHQPLSGAPLVAKAQSGYSFVPFNTAQLSVNFTNFGWHQALSPAPNPPNAQPGFVTGPFSPASVATLDWQPPLSTAPSFKRAIDSNPQLPVYPVVTVSNTVTIDKWQVPLSTAAPVAKARQGEAFVPYNTAQIVAGAYTNFWLQPLSIAVPVARAQAGGGLVPFDTAQVIANVTGIPLDLGDAGPGSRPVYYQSRFETPYPTAAVANTVTIDKWQVPLSVAAKVARVQVGFGFVPFNTTQIIVTTPGQRRPTLFIANLGRLMNH